MGIKYDLRGMCSLVQSIFVVAGVQVPPFIVLAIATQLLRGEERLAQQMVNEWIVGYAQPEPGTTL